MRYPALRLKLLKATPKLQGTNLKSMWAWQPKALVQWRRDEANAQQNLRKTMTSVRLNLQGDVHRRLNLLTNEWVLVCPHRTVRPWQGQVEAAPQTPSLA